MHLLTEQTIGIRASAEKAYRYITDMERFGEWFPGVMSIISASTHGHGEIGKEYLETVVVPLRGTREIAVRVRDAEPYRFFATEGEFRPLMPRMEIAFDALGDGACSVTFRMFSRSDNRFVRLALIPLARRVMNRRAAVGLPRLKRALETSPNISQAATIRS